MGEKLLRNVDTFMEARSKFYLIVDKLLSSCLLLRDEKRYIMLHDVVRDVAISIASEESNRFIVRAGMNLTQWPNVELGNCKRLSLMSNNITCFLPYQIEAPNLLTLCLNENSDIKEIPSEFFEGMQNLRTLDLSWIGIQSLPTSFSCLKSLRVLCMDKCYSLVDISQIEWLKSLEILSLRECRRIESWESLGKLTTLKMLDLSLIYQTASFPAKVISNLHQLEDLRIIGRIIIKGDDVNQSDDDVSQSDDDQSDEDVGQSYENVSQSDEDVGQSDDDQSDEDVSQSDEDVGQSDDDQSDDDQSDDDVGLSEVACLTRLTCLHMSLMNNECNSQVVPSYWQNLTDFRFEVRSNLSTCGYFSWQTALKNTMPTGLKNTMILELSSISVPNWILVLSGLTNSLFLSKCPHLKSVEQLDPSHSFDNLKCLSIERCEQMTHLYSTASCDNLKLLRIKVCSMKHLYSTASCEAKAPMYAFRNLETLELEFVDELVAFCDGTIPQGFFQNLKSLMVLRCKFEGGILIPCDLLERLQNLEELKVFYAINMEKVVQLEKSTTNATQSMSSSGPSFPIFPKLRQLHISLCSKLKYLLPMRVLREIRQLEILKISHSKSMVMIVEPENYEDEGIEVDQEKAILPRLKSLHLEDLPELMSFCPSRLCFDWPALEYVTVYDCPRLKRLPLHTNSAPKLRTLDVEQQWFDGLEWEDESLKSRLQPLLLD
ncbi:Nb-arc domain-containing disease resistance protein [Thalictrum thalictroides]|uniref:Nb-arc domain-containing disease resistance protein n=1 Tax=Thalictrum thalictroides TaxID=46969 RepID=A0A7J6W453_THATH|nr:Nb-arc domain-containing disease resistance protein [Thalictrum thalictroides]